MANNKFYTKSKEIDGVTYTAQFNGLSASLKAIDSTYIDGTTVTSTEKMANYILENVIVDPKLTVDDFDSMETLNKVVAFGADVMHGKFRDEHKDEKPVKAES